MVGLISAGILAALLVVSLVVHVVALKFGVQWVRSERATYLLALAATALILLCEVATLAGDVLIIQAFRTEPRVGAVFSLAAGFIGAMLLPLGTIMLLFRLSMGRAFLAWLWPMIASLGALILTLAIVRPLLVEAFQVPTNAMAPTLKGRHHRSVCPECGGISYASVKPETVFRDPYRMICDKFHTSEHEKVPPVTYDGDRFLVAKFVKPRRWDLLVFRFPQNPKTLYVMRLVGLPGETITIDNGVVHADGQPLPMPSDLEGQTYLSEVPHQRFEMWGTVDRPARLDAGEYFVLGDFSASSYDSRMWSKGAAGHNAYAVPASHIVGVVSTIYWPPERWRAFR